MTRIAAVLLVLATACIAAAVARAQSDLNSPTSQRMTAENASPIPTAVIASASAPPTE